MYDKLFIEMEVFSAIHFILLYTMYGIWHLLLPYKCIRDLKSNTLIKIAMSLR